MNTNNPKDPLYHIVSEGCSQKRIYKLMSFSLSTTSKKERNGVLEEILNEEGAIGVIEWWHKGSIIHKPKTEFHAILVKKK